MKRFFCIKCKKVKRVRKFPSDISNQSAINPFDRIGSCEYHSGIQRTIRRISAINVNTEVHAIVQGKHVVTKVRKKVS